MGLFDLIKKKLLGKKDKVDLSALDTIPLFNSYPENRSFFGKKSAKSL